ARLAGGQEIVVRHNHQSDGRVEARRREKPAGLHARREKRLPIRKYGDPILRAKGKRIEAVDDDIRALAESMLETMHAANGIGLAAQQVGRALQLTVLDVSPAEDRPSTLTLNGEPVADLGEAMPLILLNPILRLSAETDLASEGCLSFPEINADIERAISVEVEAETIEGEKVRVEASGLLSRALQHEVDHLNGILFIDRMSSASKVSHSSRLKRLQKETQSGME
ncbi:MAG: peptide deformylase, partial [Verrucomicrobiota bacterium]|nr:peptide deformylase [Verrucomicrobiota bacterium]